MTFNLKTITYLLGFTLAVPLQTAYAMTPYHACHKPNVNGIDRNFVGCLREGLAITPIETGTYGFVNENGKWIIPAYYELVDEFSEGLAAVQTDSKWGFIDKTGKEVLPMRYDSAYQFIDGLAPVAIKHKWGFIDKTGKVVIAMRYDSASHFAEGFAAVKIKGKWGYINKAGNLVIPARYDFAEKFSEGMAKVYINGKEGYINTQGEWVIAARANTQFDDEVKYGVVRVMSKEKFGLLDKTGKTLIALKYDWLGNAGYPDMWLVREQKQMMYLNTNGKKAIEQTYREAHEFSEGLAMVSKDGERYFFIDRQGKTVIPASAGFSPHYDNEGAFDSYFYKGKAFVRHHQCEWVYIDTKGKMYPVKNSFYDGLKVEKVPAYCPR